MSKESRHGKRAEGKTATSVSLSKSLLEQARELAKSEGRSLSNWLERLLAEKVAEENTKKGE